MSWTAPAVPGFEADGSPSPATGIVYVGRAPVKAKRVIDAAGKVVSPGFIDMHSHLRIRPPQAGRPWLQQNHPGRHHGNYGRASIGRPGAGSGRGRSHDGDARRSNAAVDHAGRLFSPICRKRASALNVASYVGAGRVRASVMGYENRQPTPAGDGQDQAADPARHGGGGAFGLSNGLAYVPNMFFNTAQLTESVQSRSQLLAASSPSISATSRSASRGTKD